MKEKWRVFGFDGPWPIPEEEAGSFLSAEVIMIRMREDYPDSLISIITPNGGEMIYGPDDDE